MSALPRSRGPLFRSKGCGASSLPGAVWWREAALEKAQSSCFSGSVCTVHICPTTRTSGSAVSLGLFSQDFFSAPPCSSRLLPSSVSPASMDMMDSCLMTTVLCIILMAGYNLIPASCLITLGMNTKHTLRGRWEETQPRRNERKGRKKGKKEGRMTEKKVKQSN